MFILNQENKDEFIIKTIGKMAPDIQCLPSKCEALTSFPSTSKKKIEGEGNYNI
jgi:hypothetical protein